MQALRPPHVLMHVSEPDLHPFSMHGMHVYIARGGLGSAMTILLTHLDSHVATLGSTACTFSPATLPVLISLCLFARVSLASVETACAGVIDSGSRTMMLVLILLLVLPFPGT